MLSILGGNRTKPIRPPATNPLPVLTSLSASSLPAGSPDTVLTITGNNFFSESTIYLNGVAKTTTYVSKTSITCTIAAALMASAGMIAVQVKNSSGASVTLSISIFNPSLSLLSPPSVAAGSGNTDITITGANFISTSQAQANATNITTVFNSITSLTATIPSTMLTGAGSIPINVFNGTAGSNNLSFTVTGGGTNPVPAISSISPAFVSAGDTNPQITVTGTGFYSGSVVKYNGSTITPDSVTGSTSLAFTLPTASVNALVAHVGEIVVFNTTPGGGTSNVKPIPGRGTRNVTAVNGQSVNVALQALPVFNATDYGAVGDGVTDDTVAIRAAKTAAENAGGGYVYLPATHAVCEQSGDSPVQTIFPVNTLVGSVPWIGFVGNMSGTSKLMCYYKGLTDPKKNWFCDNASLSIGRAATRFYAIRANTPGSSDTYSGIDIRDLTIDGQDGYTGDFTQGCRYSKYNYDSATNGAPAVNTFQFNNATIASATRLYVDTTPILWAGNPGPATFLLSTVGANGGTFSIFDPTANVLKYFIDVSGGTVAGTVWTFTITAIRGVGGGLTNGQGQFLSNGDGWDNAHKCVVMGFAGNQAGVLVYNSTLQRFKGEIVYLGGSGTPTTTLAATTIQGSNASVISCSTTKAVNCTIGGTTTEMYVLNGCENLLLAGATRTLAFYGCTVQNATNGLFGLIPTNAGSFIVDGIAFKSCGVCVGVDSFGHNVTVNGCTFDKGCSIFFQSSENNSGNPSYGNNPGFDTITLSNNTGDLPILGVFFSPGSYTGVGAKGNFTNLTLSGNNITCTSWSGAGNDARFISGALDGTAGGWTNWIVSGNTLGVGVQDIDGAVVGNAVGLWSSTTRPTDTNAHFFSTMVSRFGNTPVTVKVQTDSIALGGNSGASPTYVELDPTQFVNIPDQFVLTFYATFLSNWKVHANSAWNDLSSDQTITIGQTGVRMKYNAGLTKFQLFP